MKTVYIPSVYTSVHILRALSNAGLSVVHDGNVKCDFSVCPNETQIQEVQDNCESSGTPVQILSLLNKPNLIDKFESVGQDVLSMIELNSAADLDAIEDGNLILKPAVGAGARQTTPLAYRRFNSKQELLQALPEDFWETQATASVYDKLWVQKSVVPVGELPLLTILDGFVNGQGEVKFLPCFEHIHTGNGPQETYDVQISDEVQQQLQDKTRQVVTEAGVKNSFFMMQFIRSRNENVWYPIDFQYRLSYTYLHALSTYDEELYTNTMKYVYDLVPTLDIPSNVFGFVRKINVNVKDRNAEDICKMYGVVPIANYFVPKTLYSAPENREILFLTYAESTALAKQKMDAFEQEIGA